MAGESWKSKEFGERLLAVEPLTAQSAQHLEKELSTMFVRELSTFRRVVVGFVGVFALLGGIASGTLAFTEAGLPPLARGGLGVGAVFGLAWAVMAVRMVRRGTIVNLDSRRMAAMVWIFTLLMMVFFLMVGMSTDDRILGLMMMANGLAFLICAAVYWLTHRIEQAELATREKLLQLELRIAELCEKGVRG